MKQFSAKTVDEAVAQAAKELGVDADDLVYKVLEEKKALFGKKATIEVYELSDVIEFAQEYVKNVIESLGIGGVTTNASLEDDIIRIEIDSDHNPILIGKNGVTLQALNEITRLAVSGRVASIARRVAKEVQRSHQDAVLDPMPSDERRVVHNALSNFSHIKTESNGEGRRRAVTIKYVD